MQKHIHIIILFFLFTGTLAAQSEFLGFGFRAGLSYSRIDGPSEIGPGGESLESFDMANGFHIGALVNFKFTDLVGLRAEFVFSQRGTDYTYEGPSYFQLGKGTVNSTILGGMRRQTLNVSNAFIDIPVMAYYKIGSFEIAGGLNTGLLVASSGGGSIDYEGISALGTPLTPFRINLNHNYKSDDAGQAFGAAQSISVDGRSYTLPTAVGAYFDFGTRDKSLYKSLDFGLVAQAAYFINESLFLSARYVHGLGDVDRNEYDISLQSLSNGNLIPRVDENKSQSWQFSIGFSF